MKKALLCLLAASGLLALVPTTSKAHDFGFEVSVGPGYYEGGRCGPGYSEDGPYYDYRPAYYYRRYYYRPAYGWPYYRAYYHRGHHCRHWEDED